MRVLHQGCVQVPLVIDRSADNKVVSPCYD